MSNAQQRLLDKLEELKIWQEQEQIKLIEKQQSQRKELNAEQEKLYEILGISQSKNDKSSEKPATEFSLDIDEFAEYRIEVDEENLGSSDSETEKTQVPTKTTINDKIISPLSNLNLDIQEDMSDKPNIVKKPFLKRGAGLTTRFRVHPDNFKLENLPKYKYAERVSNVIRKNNSLNKGRRSAESENAEKPKRSSAELASSQNLLDFLAPPEKSTNRVSTEVPKFPNFRIEKPSKFPETSKTSTEENQIPATSDFWFKNPSDQIEDTPKLRQNQRQPLVKSKTWGAILNSNSVLESSLSLTALKNKIQELDINENIGLEDTNIFELLEQKLNDSSFVVDNSTIVKVLEALKNQEINETVRENASEASSEENSDEEETETDHRVRFSDDIVVVDDESVAVIAEYNLDHDEENETLTDAETILSTDLEAMELSKTSTPNEKIDFLEFKKKMFGKKVSKIAVEPIHDLKEKGNIMEHKLKELEKQIGIFREQNSIVDQMKQELEFAKIQLENEREEMLEKIKDDRVKVEIFLHDQRLKLEDDRKKYEKLLKDARNPNRKERDEVTRLKQIIETMKEEEKTRESRHGSSQARFRAQVKQLEKENESKKFEIDALKKEVRKLETENAHLRRDNSSKLLQEINKNIQKLTPPNSTAVEKPADKKKTVTNAPKILKTQKSTVNRRSEPLTRKTVNKRFVSEPDLTSKSDDENISEQQPPTQDSSSTDEEDIFKQKSAYFRRPKSRSIENKENVQTSRYSDPVAPTAARKSESVLDSMKREIENPDGSKDIWYPNGNLKKISSDGMVIRMLYYNKDIKETNMNEGTIRYYYADRNTWHTTYIDGLEILEYPDGQMEHRYKDGTIELHFPNGSIRITNPNNTEDLKEEWRYSDGSNVKIFNNDTKIVQFPNGQREIHTANNSRREYPDGTVKIVYKDGSQETRYSDGRIRIKDKDGKLISDALSVKK